MILDLFRLDGKVAIITGAGRGIGAASAVALAECGADVVISSRTQSDLDTVANLVAATGRRAISVAGDLVDLDVVRSLAAAVAAARRAAAARPAASQPSPPRGELSPK